MFSENIDSNLLAILGPTNTGKTHLAFDRLLSYQSGIFGFPLRLLARENYDKAIKKLGAERVALITGEEKILPKNPKYYFCTVESMPTNIKVECIAIDEIQLCSDYERGHIFTNRILYSRGSLETIFLGSLTIKKILSKIIPNIKIQTRERFSKLNYSKKYNISKIHSRSAIIAFNINKVYEIAESLRSLKGGTAVILGSLSPRTRNAQVEIYENKKVDYLVATDAIGMGLNLNIDHVLFSSIKKYDGRFMRNLHPAEIGQIAGRAGRYLNDGTFGLIKGAGDIDPLTIQSIEEHRFENIKKIYWRNSMINFSSISTVLNSLSENPKLDYFIKKNNAEDEISFKKLSSDQDVNIFLNNPHNIKLLWDVCRIPDFQKIMNDNYLELLKNAFITLLNNDFLLPEEWINSHVSKLENYSGGIEELAKKIAYIRTWTYISNQSNWLKDKKYWQEKTRIVEDNLSDQLHEKLTLRFIDNSTTFFLDNNKKLIPNIEIIKGELIKLDGKIYGSIYGFNLKLSNKIKSLSKFVYNHVKKTIRSMMKEKFTNFINAPSDAINLGNLSDLNLKDSVKLYWGNEPIGILNKGANIYSPIVEIIDTDYIEHPEKKIIVNKLQDWINNQINIILKPIKDDIDEKVLSGDLRSIIFNLFNSLGTMPIGTYSNNLKNLSTEKKTTISKLGIRIGAKFFFMPNLLKKNSIELKPLLWKVFYQPNLSGNFPLPKDGRVSFDSELSMPDSYWQTLGYLCINKFAVRIDVFERVFFIARQKNKNGPFLDSPDLMNPLGCNSNQLSDLLGFCGFTSILTGSERRLFIYNNINLKKQAPKKRTKKKIVPIKKKKIQQNIKEKKIDPDSPFAVLQKLL